MENKRFVQVFIKNEADLPKEEGEYHVKKKDSFRLTTMVFKPDHPVYIKDWLFDYEVEWYLQPLPEQPESTEEIRKELDNAYLKGFETGKYDQSHQVGMPTDEEIMEEAERLGEREDSNRKKFIDGNYYDGFIDCGKWFKSQLNKR